MTQTADDLLRLRHMRDTAREVIEFTADASREDLDTNRMLFRALCMSIGIIGEAASQVSPEFRSRHSEIPWGDIIGMRNFLFHVYHRIDSDVLWQTATVNVVELNSQLEGMLPPDEERG